MSKTESDRPVHEAALLFPPIEGEAYEKFREDIKKNGLMHPIAIMPDGSVIDGRNRLRACLELEMEPKFVTVNPESPMAYVLSANKHRRHLTSSQLSMLAADEVPKLRPEAEERIRDGGRRGGIASGEKRSADSKPRETFSEPSAKANYRSKSVERAAELFGTNANYVQSALTIRANAPDLAEKVVAGEMSIRQAQVACKERTGKRAQIVHDAARRRAGEFGAKVASVVNYCESVNVDVIRGDERLRRQWKEACEQAIKACRDFLRQLNEER